ncbi:cation diffusion zinc membrane transporter Zrg17 [Rhizina undulata]
MASTPLVLAPPKTSAITPPTPTDSPPSPHKFDSPAPPSPRNFPPAFSAQERMSSSPSSNIGPSPFNFQPMLAAKPAPMSAAKPNQRRGHKYKRSSVSHQIFLEPPIRAPLALPASLPIPTKAELYNSITPSQRIRICWCICHLFVAAYTLYSAGESLSMTALSHLVVFDALSASVCVVVDIFTNFEVWQRSSVRHPFGLERAEVLAGFAMAVFLLFMGMDLVSHAAEHVLGRWYEEHGEHGVRIKPGSVDFAAVAAGVSTVVSAVALGNHKRIGKAMRQSYLSSLPPQLSNPSHLLTLIISTLHILLPLLSISPTTSSLDLTLALTTAVAMIILGISLIIVLSSILLVSYNNKPDVEKVLEELRNDKEILAVEEAKFAQVHYGLCIANLKVLVGREVSGEKVRERVIRIVRERLGGAYGMGAVKWEVSVAVGAE